MYMLVQYDSAVIDSDDGSAHHVLHQYNVHVPLIKLQYDLHNTQDLAVGVSKLSMSWTTTAHRCLFHTVSYLLEDVKLIKGTAHTQCVYYV